MVRREFLESMVDIAAEGRTVLLSSHQIGEVERVADIVAIMHAGRLVVVERLDALKQSTRQLTITVAESKQKKRNNWAYIVVPLVVLAAAGWLVWRMFQPQAVDTSEGL